ncbi:aminoacyl-tRNA hydrolase [Vaginisenegalia massiliensis]|uniref:aminoacyl-tRNA hydrolase n=1 Tax=Vaginisenegalia massiliensis TaxID=2058294 RepID=UPI000F535516|nr:aminoacyl-tRNA hydrolase [Vaginisenegalia massiliensis]
MKLIIGLGNPGEKYAGTRHNIGFDVVDQLLERHHLKMTDQKFRADYTVAHIGQEKVLFVKPYTYMNLSGEALLPLMSYYHVAMEDILVVYDDLDLEPGRIRLRQTGSAGGHNGIKSIIQMLGSQDFNRIRVGIGRPSGGWKVVDHVLAPFSADQRPLIDQANQLAADAVEYWLQGHDFIDVMNRYNQRKA